MHWPFCFGIIALWKILRTAIDKLGRYTTEQWTALHLCLRKYLTNRLQTCTLCIDGLIWHRITTYTGLFKLMRHHRYNRGRIRLNKAIGEKYIISIQHLQWFIALSTWTWGQRISVGSVMIRSRLISFYNIIVYSILICHSLWIVCIIAIITANLRHRLRFLFRTCHLKNIDIITALSLLLLLILLLISVFAFY